MRAGGDFKNFGSKWIEQSELANQALGNLEAYLVGTNNLL